MKSIMRALQGKYKFRMVIPSVSSLIFGNHVEGYKYILSNLVINMAAKNGNADKVCLCKYFYIFFVVTLNDYFLQTR